MVEKRVMYLIGGFAVGGKERLVLDILERVNDLPYKACCVCRKGGEGLLDCIIPISSKKIIPFLIRLRKEVRSRQIQIIHAQSAYDALLAILATVGMKAKVVQTFHSYEFSTAPVLKFLEKASYRLCARSVFVSKMQQQHFAEVHQLSTRRQSKQVIVYNGVNFERFKLVRPENRRPIRMAMVGNFVPEKNQLFVCEFLQKLKALNVSFDFSFVGECKQQYPTCYKRCVDYCASEHLEDCVHFLGKREDVPELLSQVDAFVYCSKSETFGLAVVEAVSMGIPTFINDIPVFKEIFEDGGLVNFYPSGDMQYLLDLFMDFVLHQEAYQQKAIENAQAVREKYSISSHISNLDSIYSQLIFSK